MTADARYAANLDILKEVTPHIVAGVADFPLTNLRLFPNGHGQTVGHAWSTSAQAWTEVCNAQDPLGEAEADCDNLYSRDLKVFTLLGLGLGYFAAALARRLEPHQRLVIYDLDPTFYKAAMYCVDFRELLVGKRVDILVGQDVAAQVEPWWLGLETLEKLHIAGPLRSGYTQVVMREEYDALMASVVDMMRFHGVGLATWKQFGAAIGNNDLLNMPEYFATPGFDALKGMWAGKPAVCVAAGPSLHKNLRLLTNPDLRRKVVVIAVGTVLSLLRSLGITPDIVTTIDFQRLNWTDQFQHLPLDHAPALVYLHSTYPQTVRRWPGACFVGENASDTVNWLRQYTDPKASAAIVQTVAHLNLLVAAELGCSPVCLIGQDLSMPVGAHHAHGARAQDAAPGAAPEDAFVVVPDFQGNPVHSRHSFLSMLTVFARIAREHPAVQFANCSEAGLAIPGVPNAALRDCLEAFPDLPPEELWSFRRRVAKVARDFVPRIDERLYADLAGLRREVDLLVDNSRRVVGFVREMGLATEALRRWVLDREAPLQAHRAAFGLFCIRHFGLIELMAEVPPAGAGDSREAQERYNCDRLVRVAGMILEEAPAVEALLRTAEARLLGQREARALVLKGRATLESVLLAIAQQRYKDALALLACLDDPQAFAPHGLPARLYQKVFWHQQQYAAAQALGYQPPCWRLEQVLDRQARDVAANAARYHTAPQPTPTPEEV